MQYHKDKIQQQLQNHQDHMVAQNLQQKQQQHYKQYQKVIQEQERLQNRLQEQQYIQVIQQQKNRVPGNCLVRRASINSDDSGKSDEEWPYSPKIHPLQKQLIDSQHYPAISPPSAQRTRQAVKSQMSVESSKQLKHSAVLSSADTNRIYNQDKLGQNIQISNQQNKSLTTQSAHTASRQNSLTKTKKTDLSNSDCVLQHKFSNIASNSVNTVNTSNIKTVKCGITSVPHRKKLPPPPTDPPPCAPRPNTSAPLSEITAVNSVPIGAEKMSQNFNIKNQNVQPIHANGFVPKAISTTKGNKNSKIPPPLQATHIPIQKSPSNNKISMRQDSSISSDSFSQTSSPSYTTKTMETPLLPQQSSSSRFTCNGKIACGHNKLFNVVISKNNSEAFDLERDGKHVTCSSPLTKSISTPASLQTIVRFHNGSNMSLHHRVSIIIFVAINLSILY